MNLFKSLKNRKGAIGAIGAISAGIIILILAFAIASVSFAKPVLANTHTSTVDVTPHIVPNVSFVMFTAHVTWTGGPDPIHEFRVYQPLDFTGLVCYEAEGWYPPQYGYTTINSTEYYYCQWNAKTGYRLDATNPTKDFTFSLNTAKTECCRNLFVETRDDHGFYAFHNPGVCIDTSAPITTKSFDGPQKKDGYVEWIDGVTKVVLDPVDPEPHPAGVDKTWYLNVIDNSEESCWYPETYCNPIRIEYPLECINEMQIYCDKHWEIEHFDSWEKCVEFYAYDECDFGDGNWKLYTEPFTKEESCHDLYYFSVDNVNNIEGVKANCFFVDKTSPISQKSFIGKTYTDPSGQVWITQNTLINLSCQDQPPHPSDDVKIYFRYQVDGGAWWPWALYTPLMSYVEDSNHTLEWYCVDAVNKTEATHTEMDRVDTTPPIITKTVIGPQVGVCPPNSPSDNCYIKDTASGDGTIIHVEAVDNDTLGCAVGQVKCEWGYYLDGRWSGMIGDDVIPPFNVTFSEDSTHILRIKCWDKLGNKVEENETFLVDSTPPTTNKTYGEPTKVERGYRWITSDTPIDLTSTDVKVGVDKIQWRVTKLNVPDEDCTETCSNGEFFDYGEGDWNDSSTNLTFTIGEDSCHLIEFYANDSLGNTETVHRQCVFVDNKEPKGIKEVGAPNVPIGSVGVCGTVTGDLDVFFLFDLTGSMGGVINSAKANAIDVMDDIQALVPDAEFGTGSFRDYPSYYSSCGYSSTYGDSGDAPWSLDQNITNDTTAVSTAINTYYADGGADGPESYARALYESQFINWRSSAKKVVVIFNDNVPHDCNLGDYDDCYSTTGTDPGPDGIAENGDDVTWDDVTAQLKAAGISVISIDSGYSDSCRDAVWGYIANETGGASAMLGSDFTKTIVDLVTKVIGDCNKDWWVRDHVTPITLDCDDSWNRTEPHPVDEETVCYKITFDSSTYLTSQYCSEFGGYYNSTTGECCAKRDDGKLPYIFNFTEDSNHTLEWYCKDYLGNMGLTESELFRVDSTPPVINETVGDPKVQVDGDLYIRDHVTPIMINPYDNESLGCAVGEVECKWRYQIDDGDWSDWYDTFPVIFNEDSTHNLEIYCEDALGNSVDKTFTFKVDSTPPVTRKMYSQPCYPTIDHSCIDTIPAWLTNTSNITLSAIDPIVDGCHVGGTQIWYRVTLVGDDYCKNETICQSATGSGDWQDSTIPDVTKTFTIPNESCHLIEYFSNDSLGNTEDVHKQCVYIDTTGPSVNKTIDDPKEHWAGDNTFYPNLTDRCWSTDPAKMIECWKITLGTELSLKCNDDIGPHPVGYNKMCFKLELDGDDVTEDYCTLYEGNMKDGFCCGNEIPSFHFREESQHDLQIYCEDALGNKGPTDEEKFKVEGCPFEICLNKKWNLISVPYVLFNDDPNVVFNESNDKIVSVWAYDNGNWSTWAPNVSGTLTDIKPGWGYWVLSKEDDVCFEIAGSLFSPLEIPPSRTLQPGWNLIGHYGSDGIFRETCELEGRPVYCALNSLIDTQEGFPRWSSLYNYFNNGSDDAGWTGLDACISKRWAPAEMEPGKGYWIEMDVSDGYAPATNCIWNSDLKCITPILA